MEATPRSGEITFLTPRIWIDDDHWFACPPVTVMFDNDRPREQVVSIARQSWTLVASDEAI